MKNKIRSLISTIKTVDTFGIKYVADYPATSTGGQQFVIVHAAVSLTANLGATQVSGGEQVHGAVLGKVACRFHLRRDMRAISDAAHSIALLGTADTAGKFLMPHSNGDQALLNSARAFAADAPAFQTQFISLGLAADFIATLNTDIGDFETVIKDKGAAAGKKSGATGGLEDAVHKAAIALHVLDTIVKNTYKDDPAKLAEWATASHVQRHTPKAKAKPAQAASQK